MSLKHLAPENDIALAMLTILEKTTISDEMLDQMFSIIKQAIKDSNNQADKEKFQSIQTQLDKIKKQEIDEESTIDLEKIINTL